MALVVVPEVGQAGLAHQVLGQVCPLLVGASSKSSMRLVCVRPPWQEPSVAEERSFV